jgi:hypothetical protein
MTAMRRSLLGILLLLFAAGASAQPPDPAPWTGLLERHVQEIDGGASTAVDYGGFARDRRRLDGYLDALSAVPRASFDGWSRDDQLAFLINAYNAWTVALILSRWPDIESIKDLGGFLRSPWEKRFFRLLGERRSLDDVEHGLIRGSGRYSEPRIHFAVNCASIGCPPLRREAYIGARLDAQLEEQARTFLADDSRNRLANGVLRVSPLFKWYREDFSDGFRGARTVTDFLALYADALSLDRRETAALEAGELPIDYLDYDWALNDLR